MDLWSYATDFYEEEMEDIGDAVGDVWRFDYCNLYNGRTASNFQAGDERGAGEFTVCMGRRIDLQNFKW